VFSTVFNSLNKNAVFNELPFLLTKFTAKNKRGVKLYYLERRKFYNRTLPIKKEQDFITQKA